MKTVEVSRAVFQLMFLSTVVCLTAGCIAILSWVVTGQPHPDWVTIRQPTPFAAPPIIHRTTQSPIPLVGGDPELIPPTDLPTK